MPGHGAQIRYSLGTNVNTPFFQAPTLEFGHVPERDLLLGYESGNRSLCAHRVFVCSGTVTASYSLLSSCFKIASDRAIKEYT